MQFPTVVTICGSFTKRWAIAVGIIALALSHACQNREDKT